jgi:hypothetical protein
MGRKDVRARGRLHDHDTHVVRDHVVQLARDPRALGGDRPARALLPVALQALRTRLELGQVGAPRAQVVPERPRRSEDRVHRDAETRFAHPALGDGRDHQRHRGRSRRRDGEPALAMRGHRVKRDHRPGKLEAAEQQIAGDRRRQRDREHRQRA